MIPQQWRIIVPIALAFGLAMFNAIKLAFTYIPSSVKIMLEFRYGTIGSLHDGDFLGLRQSVDDASFVFPAMFWGKSLHLIYRYGYPISHFFIMLTIHRYLAVHHLHLCICLNTGIYGIIPAVLSNILKPDCRYHWCLYFYWTEVCLSHVHKDVFS